MTIQELKNSLVDRSYIPDMLIMKYTDTDFIPMQYVRAIKDITGKDIESVDDIDNIPRENGFFGEPPIYLYKNDSMPSYISYRSNLIIITKTISDTVKKDFEKYIVEMPKIEPWMVEDFVLSICNGLDDGSVKWFLAQYNSLYKIELELNKLSIFPKESQQSYFKLFREENAFAPNENEWTFTLSTALQNRDVTSVKECLLQLQKTDVEPMALLSLVHGALKKLIKVWLNKSPTTENTGLKSNQIWAINKLPRVFNREELLDKFETLSLIDCNIKSGEFPIEILFDYIIIKILT